MHPVCHLHSGHTQTEGVLIRGARLYVIEFRVAANIPVNLRGIGPGTPGLRVGARDDTLHCNVEFLLADREVVTQQPLNTEVFCAHQEENALLSGMGEHITGREPAVCEENGDSPIKGAVVNDVADSRIFIFLFSRLDDGIGKNVVCEAVRRDNMDFVVPAFLEKRSGWAAGSPMTLLRFALIMAAGSFICVPP